MSKFWSNLTKELKPYVPGEQPKDKKYIKLNTNESPYGPSPKINTLLKEYNADDLRLYPEPTSEILRETISQYYGLTKDEVFIGNGSDEVLALCFMAYFDKNDQVVYPDISYSFYNVYAKLFQLQPDIITLDNEFKIPVEQFLNKNAGIIFPNPNAPTGRYLEIEYVEKIIKTNPDTIVIVDEAYIDFGGESAVKFIKDYDNVLVVQTFSKSRSLAGSRLGFALGQKELIEGLTRVKDSFNSYPIDRLAMLCGVEAFKDVEYFELCRKKIIQTREKTVKTMKELGFHVIPSQANFIFAEHKKIRAEDLFISLKQNGILVRYFKANKIDNYLRITIGTDQEMDALVEFLKKLDL
ncbi:MAG: histidinol-phosphate transaminase [Spirochaetes bacterium GWF1_31_7]|nr:MAG: histidinol-phosphate transaminase [Spirochaetes bacterium GWE1_32_154]OHD50089.1 MAG: histidinol-phosphate transaminase [Spirochaetes bacterium GWE2_31_10]OHD52402.1 MAG: histidinol-phosphate transaminase [Spirochaetes bacterium GWF1_31_7]OHD82637.1 MAG: histidinol-phosphate transaminase [Spirochaetes bacterium RIFOXYB1_FULL_32_8]HBD96046.1 histidinol-phosphate transaminase [Spirochaetia bacterium]